ncbi:MAG: hypothetical protein GTN59_08755, partial [Candidatus Dadabacteria bacterium]|nr:hypothetical protein [Candidatus Dadabacteria bacterium]
MVSSFMTGYTYRDSEKTAVVQQPNYKQVINNNSEIIHTIGVTAQTQSVVTNLIMEIAEEFRSEEEKLNPPPTQTRDRPLWDMYNDFKIEEGDDTPTTFEQVILDHQEIKLSIRSLGYGNIFQEEQLKTILKRIRDL